MYGYWCKLCRVNLSDRSWKVEDIAEVNEETTEIANNENVEENGEEYNGQR